MKNQYFGDINDYIKYGMLRIIADVTKQKIGVCWMLTADDEGNDGNKIHYQKKHDEYKKYDSELFDHLCKVHEGKYRDIKNARVWDIIKDADYYEEILTDNLIDRECYFTNAHSTLDACPIIFFDPDNGLEVASVKKGRRKSSKFVYFDELESFFEEGKTLFIFQHFPRENREVYTTRRIKELKENFIGSEIRAYMTSNVVYFMILPKGVTYNFTEIEKRMNGWKDNNRLLISWMQK